MGTSDDGAKAPPFDISGIYTTGEAARICRVSQQTIIRCFDAGRLHGFRVPGSRFRRIPGAELQRFIERNAIPARRPAGDGADATARTRVLLVSSDDRTIEQIQGLARDGNGQLELRAATTPFEAGLAVHQFDPQVLIFDADMPHLDTTAAVRRVRSTAPPASGRRVLVIGSVLHGEAAEDLAAMGAAAVHRKPLDGGALRAEIGVGP